MTRYDDEARTYSIAIVSAAVLAAGLTTAYFVLDGVGMTDRVMQRFGFSQSIGRRLEEPGLNGPVPRIERSLCRLGEERSEIGGCVRLKE